MVDMKQGKISKNPGLTKQAGTGAVRTTAARAAKFLVFRVLFDGIYRLNAKKALKDEKVVFVEVREPALSSNFQLLYRKLKKGSKYQIHIHYLRSGFASKLEYTMRCIQMLADIADAKYIFLNEGSNVVGSISMRKETILTQTWHACGAFKKFGFSTAHLKYGETAEEMRKYPYYGNTSYVTLSSPQIAWAYEEAMMLGQNKACLKPTGISRTDVFFKPRYIEAARKHLMECVPQAKGKKVLLYAPTFRGTITNATSPDCLDIPKLKQALGGEYVLVCKHHPFVVHPPVIPQSCGGFAKDVTTQLSIEELLCVADVCISDYSSLVFEFSLFERPMLFFAYDLEDYFDWRGFYYSYHELAPGPVVRSNEEIIDYILHLDERFDKAQVIQFRNRFMSACDGHATERILKMVFG